MLRKSAALLVSIALHVTAALDPNMFPCHRDLCRRGEHYCVDETQKCYHCADVVHLCNSTELSRDCDGYCYRVELQAVTKLEAATSHQLEDIQTALATEQRRNVNMTQTVEQLSRDVSTLTTINIKLTAAVNKTKTLESKYEDTIQQKRQLEYMVSIASVVCGVLVLVVILLSWNLCVTRAKKHRCPRSTPLGHLGSHEDEVHDDLPLLRGMDNYRTHQHRTQSPTKVPGLTINGDVTVSRLEVQTSNCGSASNNTPPSVFQKSIDSKDCVVDMNVASIGGSHTDVVDKGERERTPSILKNIQPTDSLEGIKHYTLDNNDIFLTDVPG